MTPASLPLIAALALWILSPGQTVQVAHGGAAVAHGMAAVMFQRVIARRSRSQSSTQTAAVSSLS